MFTPSKTSSPKKTTSPLPNSSSNRSSSPISESSLPETPLNKQNPTTSKQTNLTLAEINKLLDKLIIQETNLKLDSLPHELTQQITEFKSKLTPLASTLTPKELSTIIQEKLTTKPLKSPLVYLPKYDQSKPFPKTITFPQTPTPIQEKKQAKRLITKEPLPEAFKKPNITNLDLAPLLTPPIIEPLLKPAKKAIQPEQKLETTINRIPNPLLQETSFIPPEIIEQQITIEPKKETQQLFPEKQKEEKQKEEKIVEQNKEDKPKEQEEIKKEKTEFIPLPNFDQEISRLKSSLTIENQKEFEDQNYEHIIHKIDSLLEKLNTFYLQNENKLTPEQKRQLKAKEKSLRELKTKVITTKEQNIQAEEELLNENIPSYSLESLQYKLQQIYLDNENDIQQYLTDISDLEQLTNDQKKYIEKKLIKLKLKKASKALELPFIFALPFVRNKYFAFLTSSIIVNNHFNFLNNIFKRQKKPFTPQDLSQIQKGQDALNAAINTSYENITYYEYLINQALQNHPELKYDLEFNNYSHKLKNQLLANYQRLLIKQHVIEKHCLKTKSKIKILQRKDKAS